MPKKYVENPPTPKKNWSRNYYSFDCVQIFRAIRANSNFPKTTFFLTDMSPNLLSLVGPFTCITVL